MPLPSGKMTKPWLPKKTTSNTVPAKKGPGFAVPIEIAIKWELGGEIE